jgi:hypothetical protein
MNHAATSILFGGHNGVKSIALQKGRVFVMNLYKFTPSFDN